jgi:RNA polymerase sigma-70 factor, ECF subfamily
MGNAARDEGSLRAWLLRITVNVCRGWQRGSQGQQMRLTRAMPDDEQDSAGLGTLAAPQDEPGTSDHAGALDLRQAVRSLPPHFRVVVLRYYGGLQASEIADILSVPPVTIRTRHHRALLLLRERLEVEGVDTLAGDADVER